MNRAILSTFLIPRSSAVSGRRGGRKTRTRGRRPGALNAAFIGAVVMGAGMLIACKPRAMEQPLKGPYYTIYDQAVSLYFKPPRKPDQALKLMRRACRELKDEQALSCYNLGLLHELRGDTAAALNAYRLAQKIKPHAVFHGAAMALDPNPSGRSEFYANRMQAIIAACRNREPAGALGPMRELVEKHGKDRSFRLHQTVFLQPFIKRCLGHLREFKELLRKLPSGRRDLYKRYYKTRAKLHPFHGLWDMELHLRGLRADNRKEKPRASLARAWRKVLEATAGKDAGKTAEGLAEYYEALKKHRRSARKRAQRGRIRALGRAAALLIRRDSYFARIAGDARILELTSPWLKR